MSVIFRKGRSSLANESPELPRSVDSDADLGRRDMRAELLAKDRAGHFGGECQESNGRVGETISQDSRHMPIKANPGPAPPLPGGESLIESSGKGATKMRFVLTGFSHNAELRVFAFEGITVDGTRINFSVSADMSLSRRHGIRVQELPLLCLRFLEQHDTGEKRNLTFAEEDMCVYVNNCAAEREAAQRKRAPRRPPGNVATRTEWQYPQQRP
jgi:hypothetical protein